MRKKRGMVWSLAVVLSLLMVPSVAMGQRRAIDVFETTAGDEDSGESQRATRVEVVELRRVRVLFRDDSRRRVEPNWLDQMLGPLEEEPDCSPPPVERRATREAREELERRRSGR